MVEYKCCKICKTLTKVSNLIDNICLRCLNIKKKLIINDDILDLKNK